MRFRLQDLPGLILPILPFVVAYNGYGLLATTLLMTLWILARQAVILGTSVACKHDQRIILEAMSISHYVEKVRWGLDKLEVDYEEEADVGLLGVFLLGRRVPALRVPRKNMVIYNSADILTYLYGSNVIKGEDKVSFLKPSQEAKKWEEKIDRFGEDLRCYIYYHMGEVGPNPVEGILKAWGIHQSNVPEWQKVLVKALHPLLKAFLFKVLEVTPTNAEKSWKKCLDFLKETDELFKDGGRRYLLDTDEPTYVDYSLAALGALFVLPEKYGGRGVDQSSRITKSDYSAEARKEMDNFAKTPTAKYIARMYQEHR